MIQITKLIATYAEVKSILNIAAGTTTYDAFIKAKLPYVQDVLLNQILFNNFGSFVQSVASTSLSADYTAGDATISLDDDSDVLTGDYIEFGGLVFIVTDASTLAVTLSSGTDADKDSGEGAEIYRINQPIFPSDLKTTIAKMMAYDIYIDNESLSLTASDTIKSESIGRVKYDYDLSSISDTGYPKASYKSAEIRYKKYPLDEPITTNNATGLNA